MTDYLIGFVAAAISVVVAHQVIVLLLNKAGVWAAKPYSTAPVPPYGVPTIVNSIFWGALWGVVYAAVHHLLPAGPAWLQGVIFGLMIAIFSNSLILPLIKGQPIFYGFDLQKLGCVFLILSGFGAALAVIYEALGGG